MGQQSPGYPQAPWPQQGVPPQKDNNLKWLLVAIAVLLVIGVTIGATLLFTRGGDAPPAPSTSTAPGDIASADDTGPVSIITAEPTCNALSGINRVLADVQANGWGNQRGTLGPASSWTPDQRAQVEAVATSMRNAADQTVALAKQTPHRVMRELYEQFIAYGRAYADSVPTYAPGDNSLAGVNVSIGNTLQGICNAIANGSASRGFAADAAGAPREVVPAGNPEDPERFITTSDSTCTAWSSNDSAFLAGTNEWEKLDTSIPRSQWTPEQKAVQEAALPVFTTFSDNMEATGRQSKNPILEDFAVLGAVYLRSYVSAGESYTSSDSWLSYTALDLNNAVSAACRAAAG